MSAATLQSSCEYTLEEYLAYEESVPTKHEYLGARVFALSDFSPDHCLITANVLSTMAAGVRGGSCRVFGGQVKFGIGTDVQVVYPDGSVISGPPEFHPADPKHRLVTNPRVIVEVLSPTTEAYDRGGKFSLYRTLPSLEEYVLVSQDKPMIETFVRQADGRFVIAATFDGLDATATLASLNIQIALAEVYAGVTFPEPIPQPIFPERESS
jgi:Uma2 family endonuclease